MTELRKVGTGKTVNVNINCGKKQRNEWSDHLRLGSILLLLLHIPHLWSRIQFEQHSNVGTTLLPVDLVITQNITLLHSRNTDHHCGESFGKHQISEQAGTI